MGMTNGRVLGAARRRLGLTGPGQKRINVVTAAAAALGVAVPHYKADGYALLRRFLGEGHAPLKAKPGPKARMFTPPAPVSNEFLQTYEWRRLRYEVLKERGAKCELCNSTRADGVRICVDHIKSRRLHPELALVKSNLQVLCDDCNHGKGYADETDWRADVTVSVDPMRPRLVKSRPA